MVEKIEFEGTIRTVETIERDKKDLHKEIGHLVIMNTDGDKIDVKSGKGITEGLNPERQVKVTITVLDQTIQESTGEDES